MFNQCFIFLGELEKEQLFMVDHSFPYSKYKKNLLLQEWIITKYFWPLYIDDMNIITKQMVRILHQGQIIHGVLNMKMMLLKC